MNDFLSGSHPSLWKRIEMLKREELHWTILYSRLDNGHIPRRVKTYSLLNAKICKIVETYNSVNNRVQYLNISSCLNIN